jgi:hypothetical protein
MLMEFVVDVVVAVKLCSMVLVELGTGGLPIKFPDSVKLLKSVITAALAAGTASARVARESSFTDFMSWVRGDLFDA